MLLKVTTENAWYYIHVENGKYTIGAHNLHYLGDKILGRECKQPKLTMPLTIYFNSTDYLNTSRIKSIEYVKQKETVHDARSGDLNP